MAVPFNIPADQNEVEVIIMQLQTILNRLQTVLRQRNVTSNQSNECPRARTSSSRASHSHHFETAVTTPQTSFPDLLHNNNRSWLATASREPSHLAEAPVNGSHNNRVKSSCCGDETTKTPNTTIAIHHHSYGHEWNQVSVALKKIAEDLITSNTLITQNDVDESDGKMPPTDGLFSKIVPSTVSSCSLWTAMICFVGWHIFRAR